MMGCFVSYLIRICPPGEMCVEDLDTSHRRPREASITLVESGRELSVSEDSCALGCVNGDLRFLYLLNVYVQLLLTPDKWSFQHFE